MKIIEEKATQKQIFYIHSLVKEIGMPEEEYKDYLWKHFLVKSSKELNKKDAYRLIENLKYLRIYGWEDYKREEKEVYPEIEWEI